MSVSRTGTRFNLTLPLFRNDRIILTPHAAFLSQESLHALRTRATHQIADALASRRPPHVANPQIH